MQVVQAVAVTSLPLPSPEPSGPTDLAGMLAIATENSAALKQAAADVAAARGAALQAGLHPNPTGGYQGDQIGSGHTAGQQGVFLSQTFVTHGKLGLAQAAALAEVARTEAAMQQARADLASQVRARYYALMTATESVRISQEIARTFAALAERHQKLFDSGQPVAPHEVSQARALAAGAQSELAAASNRRTAAAKQLAAIVGNTDVAAVALDPANTPLPLYRFDQLRDRVLTEHSELKGAAAQVERAKYQLHLARIAPYPNVETNSYVQYDYQTRTPQIRLAGWSGTATVRPQPGEHRRRRKLSLCGP